MMNKQQFEKSMLEKCNKVADMMYNKSKEMNNGVSEITKEESFEMAKKLVFETYSQMSKRLV